MAVMVETPGESRRWTLDELDRLPDDGNRYELLDGELLVSPAPVPKHQLAVLKTGAALLAACPEGLMALVAPVDWRPGGPTSLQPDVLVVSRGWLDAKNITDVLPLAVEVLSPSTRRVDLVQKWAKYERAGVGSYWVVDPEVPSVVAWDLVDGRYQLVGEAQADQKLELRSPFPVTVIPNALVSP